MGKNNILQSTWHRLTRRKRHELLARSIAVRHGMLDEYIAARRNGLSPLEALEEWDIITPNERQLFD